MPSPLSPYTQMLTYSEERSILDDVQEGVEIAMHREDYHSDAIDPIKVNKLAYFAIREFDIGVTFGWYKYGPAPVDTATHQGSKGPSTELEPKPEADITASDRSRVPSERNNHPSPEEFAHFFKNFDEFHAMLTMETKEYLEEFYEQYAPETYKPLYLAGIRFQRKIDQIGDNPESIQNSSISYHSVSHSANEVFGELLKLPQLNEAVTPFKDYTDLLRDIIASIESRGDLEERVEQFINDFVSFFYTSTWKYVALFISRDTVRGDNANQLLDSIDDKIGELRSRYNGDLGAWQEHSRLFGLPPRINRYVDDMEYDDETESENEVTEPWIHLSSEVVHGDTS